MEINFIDLANEFISTYKVNIILLGTVSFVIFVFSLISIKWLVALIPSDYFINRNSSKFKIAYPSLWLVSTIIKNILGYTLIIGGILMLFLPGQGLFTIFVGLLLSNYPGKFYLERKLIAMPKIYKTVNWLRKKSNQPPLKI
ncbi:MAG: hypothetical protein CBD86_02900 [Gammaproteobacteria bacterium TMED226]|nr:MAG: hypothetical protein CBD86_02900 [Gammaproteobacteria bacterium TMED226]